MDRRHFVVAVALLALLSAPSRQAAAEESPPAEPGAPSAGDAVPDAEASPEAEPAPVPLGEVPAEEPGSEPEEAPAHVVEARERVGRGEELFAQGNFDAALVEFQRAYDVIGEHPSRYLVLYNIGQCHERSFRYDEALRFYQRYLEEGGEQAEGRDAVSASIRTLEGLLATVRIEVNVPEAEVWVDERRLGTAPGVVRIPGGLHTVEVRADGHLPARREVRLPAGGEELLELQLEELTEGFSGLHQAYFWSVGGLAVATLVTAAAVGLSALSSHNAVSRRLDDDQDRWDVTQGEIDRVGDLALAADVLFGLGAAFAVATVVLGLLTDWEGESRGQAPTVSVGPGGLLLARTF